MAFRRQSKLPLRTHRLRLKQDMAEIMLKSDRVAPALEILHDLLKESAHEVFALCRIAEFEKADLQNPIVRRIQELFNQPQSTLKDEDRVALYLAYGNAAERSSEFDMAFQSWEKAHAIDVPPYDQRANRGSLQDKHGFLHGVPFSAHAEFGESFTCSSFRHGHAAFGHNARRAILGAHSQCEGVGETGRMVFMNTAFLNKYYQARRCGSVLGKREKGRTRHPRRGLSECGETPGRT